MTLRNNPDKEFQIKLRLLDSAEETKERAGEENADIDDDEDIDNYMAFLEPLPQAGTGEENSDVENIPVQRVILSPRKPNMTPTKAASKIA